MIQVARDLAASAGLACRPRRPSSALGRVFLPRTAALAVVGGEQPSSRRPHPTGGSASRPVRRAGCRARPAASAPPPTFAFFLARGGGRLLDVHRRQRRGRGSATVRAHLLRRLLLALFFLAFAASPGWPPSCLVQPFPGADDLLLPLELLLDVRRASRSVLPFLPPRAQLAEAPVPTIRSVVAAEDRELEPHEGPPGWG